MSMDEPTPRKSKRVIDWSEVRRRIESASAGIERLQAPDAGETRRVLQARARMLARQAQAAQAPDAVEVVEFQLAHERYAVESRYVREVRPLENLTPLPCTPAFVLGIVNLRGEIMSVIDIKRFFDLPQNGLTDLDKIIVLRSESMQFGILVDKILGARRIPVTEIQRSLPTLTGIREKYLRGVTTERTVLLDAAKLLADETIIVDEQV